MPEPLTSRDVEEACRDGETTLLVANRLVTPLARERARDLGVVLVERGEEWEGAEGPPPTPPREAPSSSDTGPANAPGVRTPEPAAVEIGVVLSGLDAAWREGHAALRRGEAYPSASPSSAPATESTVHVAASDGRLLAGNACFDLSPVVEAFVKSATHRPEDAYVTSDPYSSTGAVRSTREWLVVVPIVHLDQGHDLLGWVAASATVTDAGGATPGSTPMGGTSIFGEGVRVKPCRLTRDGRTLDEGLLAGILANVRHPEALETTLERLLDAARRTQASVAQLSRRQGMATYLRATRLLLERSASSSRELTHRFVGVEPLKWEDRLDALDGSEPRHIRVTIWRERDTTYIDFAGTSPQFGAPLNVILQKGAIARQAGRLLAGVGSGTASECIGSAAQNHGLAAPFEVILPHGTLVQPREPAPVGSWRHVERRTRDAIGACLLQHSPALAIGGAAGSQCHLQAHFGDGLADESTFRDVIAQADDSQRRSVSIEALERDTPLLVRSEEIAMDSGGAGQVPGRPVLRRTYEFLQPAEVSIEDDRSEYAAWGAQGGRDGTLSSRLIRRKRGRNEALPPRVERVSLERGDQLVIRAAGEGGRGDPLGRDAAEVALDVAHGIISRTAALETYRIALDASGAVDYEHTRSLRLAK